MRVLLLNQGIGARDQWPNAFKNADLIVAPGGIASGSDAIVELQGLKHPVAYTLGKSEYMGKDIGNLDNMIDKLCEQGSVFYLQRSGIQRRDGWRILGSTLWPDYGGLNAEQVTFALLKGLEFKQIGARSWFEHEGHADYFMEKHENLCQQSDVYAKIHRENWKKEFFHPIISYWFYEQSHKWLEVKLNKPWEGNTLFISHHIPSYYCSILNGISPTHLFGRAMNEMNMQSNPALYGSSTSNITDLLMKHKVTTAIFGFSSIPSTFQINHTTTLNQSEKGRLYDLNNGKLEVEALIHTIKKSRLILMRMETALLKRPTGDEREFGYLIGDWMEMVLLHNLIAGLYHNAYWKNLANLDHKDYKQIAPESLGLTPPERTTGKTTMALKGHRISLIGKTIKRNLQVLKEWQAFFEN